MKALPLAKIKGTVLTSINMCGLLAGQRRVVGAVYTVEDGKDVDKVFMYEACFFLRISHLLDRRR